MKKKDFIQDLINFLGNAVTPFHAVQEIKKLLTNFGYQELSEKESWKINTQGKYFVIRNGSSIAVFQNINSSNQEIVIVGSHTDSPHLKLKPNPVVKDKYGIRLAVEVYGGVLLQSWFDRDLKLAGRISGIDQSGNLRSDLINYDEVIGFIPRLAIHLDREANSRGIKNLQTELNPLISKNKIKDFDLAKIILDKNPQTKITKILDWDLSFYDSQAPALVGLEQDLLVGARLDNLLSCFTSIWALVRSEVSQPIMVVCHDHEEVGSQSFVGASGSLVNDLLTRLYSQDKIYSLKASSTFLSLDNAHAIHPAFTDRHEENNAPRLGEGVAIKVNASQKYSTNSETSAWYKKLCLDNDIPYQSFVSRNDMPCGSTIGPLSSTRLGIRSVDVGIPTLGMHSIRETACTEDIYSLFNLLKYLYSRQ